MSVDRLVGDSEHENKSPRPIQVVRSTLKGMMQKVKKGILEKEC